jgi:hypothetical protein
MSVQLTYQATVTGRETLETNVPAAAAAKRLVTHDQYNSSAALSSTTTPPVTKCAYFEKALVAGAGAIDLTALVGTNGATVDGTGLKVQVFKVQAKATNANPITLSEGASNGYELLGNAWTMVLQPGQEVMVYGNDATPDVAAGAKTIDLAGTGTQALEVSIVLG